jgi:two-component system, NtrC family, response regulator HydG
MNLRAASILALDDDPDILTALRLLLKTRVKQVLTEKRPDNLPALLAAQSFDLVLLDMNYRSPIHTGNEGLFWLRKIKELHPTMTVVMMTAYGSIDLAVQSLKEGAADFVVKPWENDKLLATLNDALLREAVEREADQPKPLLNRASGPKIIGNSPEMNDIFQKLQKVAPTDANILILGENGTGKDLIAQALHERSARANKPFIKVDVGALTESLFESELFGYRKGAFTDAKEDRMGRIEAANGGTLFLDEIGNISLQQQAKLLSVLQNRQVMRLGSNTLVPVDIRLICATNVPIAELADGQRFRKDLIYRINTVELTVPPLRRRPSDIPLLAQHYAAVYAAKYGKADIRFSPGALDKLQQYAFPGNVRELQYTIERAVIMADTPELQAADLRFSSLEIPSLPEAATASDDNLNLNAVERTTILRVIEKHGGNISRAAKELGLTRTALYRRLQKYDL